MTTGTWWNKIIRCGITHAVITCSSFHCYPCRGIVYAVPCNNNLFSNHRQEWPSALAMSGKFRTRTSFQIYFACFRQPLVKQFLLDLAPSCELARNFTLILNLWQSHSQIWRLLECGEVHGLFAASPWKWGKSKVICKLWRPA